VIASSLIDDDAEPWSAPRVDIKREKDVEQLRRIALVQQVQIQHLLRVLAGQSARIDTLSGKDGELQRSLALLEELNARAKNDEESDGGRAEGRATDGGDTSGADTQKKKRKQRTKFGPTAQPQLSLVPKYFDLDDADLMCPRCGGELEAWEGKFETSEMIDVVEVSYQLVQVMQRKYRCGCGGCIETAPGPERVIEGGRYSLDFAIKVAIDKYLDHLPLSRQARILDRHGLDITSQTLWDQLEALGRRLAGSWKALFAEILREPVIGLDQTSWKRLDGSKRTPWQMWCLTSPRGVYHRICDDKGENTFTALLGGYRGVVVCDAASTHGAGARASPAIVLAACWAHVLRKFREAEPDHPEALMALDWIGKLYEIDARAEGDVDALAELRRTESVAVLTELKTWLWSQATLKSLSIGNAAAYTIANWDRLRLFITDPRIPLDNNATERGIRGPVVGRKNHYGSKSRRGTEIASILYSLIETAKLNRIDPATYLRDAAIADRHAETLLPWQLSA
jgi:transposase